MQRHAVLLASLVLMLVFSAGCSQLGPQPTPVPPTKTPKPTFTPTSAATPTQPPLPTATRVPATATPPPPTNTPVPSPVPPSPTATPVPAPKFTTNQKVNVRRGPGTAYAVIAELAQGQSFDITGKNAAGDWLQFSYNGQLSWVSAGLVTVSGDSAKIQVAQNIPAPPPPPATAVPTPIPQPTAPPAPQYPFQLMKGVERCDPNPGQTYFNGFVRYRSNAPRNGVCVHIAFYGPRSTKCSGCDGVGDGAWGFSPFGGAAPKGTTVEIYVVSCPSSGVPAGGLSQTTGFGDTTPRSEKWVYTVNDSVQCTGITFFGD